MLRFIGTLETYVECILCIYSIYVCVCVCVCREVKMNFL